MAAFLKQRVTHAPATDKLQTLLGLLIDGGVDPNVVLGEDENVRRGVGHAGDTELGPVDGRARRHQGLRRDEHAETARAGQEKLVHLQCVKRGDTFRYREE